MSEQTKIVSRDRTWTTCCGSALASSTFLTLVLFGCVSKDCPVGSAHVKGRCVVPDAGPERPRRADAGSGDFGTARDAAVDAAEVASEDLSPDAGPIVDAGHERSDAGASADAAEHGAGACGGGPSVACWKDADGDGYAAMAAEMTAQCGSACVAGWTATEPKTGQTDCDDGHESTHPTATELCNGVDDDCDSHTDEDARNLCALVNATAVCRDGACAVETCDPGYEDCDSMQSNGCEQSLTTHDSCGVCGTTCDARAECVQSPTTASTQVCECRAPLIGDGSACIGFGSLTVGSSNGVGYMCGLRTDGRVECFGSSAPSHGTSNTFSQIAGGRQFVCGIRKDDAHLIECWGDDNSHGQLGSGTQVAGSVEFVQVVSGTYHSCALLSDGTASCWGATDPSGSSTTTAYGQVTVPDEVQGNLRQLSAGWYHSCGLTRAGKAVCWGAGTSRTCGLGTSNCSTPDYGQSAAPADERFIEISAGSLHTCGLRANGSVLCWGLGVTNAGNLDLGQAAAQSGPYLFISAGYAQTCGVTPQHKVECWGSGPALDNSGNVLRVYAGQFISCELYTSAIAKCFAPSQSPVTLDNLPWSLDF